MKEDLNSSMARATKDLMLGEAFYGLFLLMCNKEWSDKINSTGVGKNGINYQMVVNPLYWESLTPLWRKSALKHNMLNIVFHHIETGANLPDKEIMSIASNLVVNQFIDPTWLPLFDVKYSDFRDLHEELYELLKEDLRCKRKTEEEVIEELRKIPPRGVYLHDFAELKLKEKMDLKYYYDELMKAKDKQPGKGGSQALNDLLGDKADGLPEGWSKDWEKEFGNMSEAEKKLLRAQTDHMMKEVAEQIKKSRGTIPSELAGYIEGLDKKDPPKFNWKGYLRRFVGGSEKVDILRSRAKYNIRFPQNPGRRIRPRAHVLVMVDTSGSVSDTELKEFFHEIHHIQKMGSDVTVLQFDAAVHSVKNLKKGLEDEIGITGRGGTSFDPPISYANEHARKFACAIVFTDGEAPAPDPGCKLRTLWVHSSKSSINESLQGFKIKLDL